MCAVYREMRSKTIDASSACKLVYVLASIGKLIEVHEIERRLDELEARIATTRST